MNGDAHYETFEDTAVDKLKIQYYNTVEREREESVLANFSIAPNYYVQSYGFGRIWPYVGAAPKLNNELYIGIKYTNAPYTHWDVQGLGNK